MKPLPTLDQINGSLLDAWNAANDLFSMAQLEDDADGVDELTAIKKAIQDAQALVLIRKTNLKPVVTRDQILLASNRAEFIAIANSKPISPAIDAKVNQIIANGFVSDSYYRELTDELDVLVKSHFVEVAA